MNFSGLIDMQDDFGAVVEWVPPGMLEIYQIQPDGSVQLDSVTKFAGVGIEPKHLTSQIQLCMKFFLFFVAFYQNNFHKFKTDPDDIFLNKLLIK